jgi:Replication-relaxation
MTLTRLAMALQTDLCLSEGQIFRHYGLRLEQLPTHLHVVKADLGDTVRSARTHAVRMVVEFNRRVDPCTLRHWAATAEVRHQLGIDLEHWHAVRTQGPIALPDAVWTCSGQRVAVEIDTGSYTAAVIKAKIKHFRATHDGFVWACTSARRAEQLSVKYGLEVLVVDWR